MSSDLMKQVNQMLVEVKQGKHKKNTTLSNGKSHSTPIEAPWADEALVLITTTMTCKSCGNEVTSWSPYIYVQRSRTIHRKVTTLIERLPICDPDIAYGKLPRRIEHRQHNTTRCPLCFGDLPNGVRADSVQLTLPFNKEYYHEQICNEN